MTAYQFLEKKELDEHLSEPEFSKLILEFRNSFLSERNFYQRLKIHRNPNELINEMLQEAYETISRIQCREEMRDVEIKEEKTIGGYVNSRITEIWKADKRLKSLYNATIAYCKLAEKSFTIIGAHVAEFRGVGKVIRYLQKLSFSYSRLPVSTNPLNKEKKSRTRIPKEAKIRAMLQKEINSICPFCTSHEVGHFQIHHIDENPSNHEFYNLFLVCPTCHSKINKGDIKMEEVLEKKKSVLEIKDRKVTKSKTYEINANIANVISGGKNIINIKESKRTKAEYPQECIGADPIKANYVSYLIDKYEKYKEWELKDQMKWGLFRKQLKNKYKVGGSRKVNHIPMVKFQELVEFIQEKIDGSKLGKITSKKHGNYELFSDYEANQKKSRKHINKNVINIDKL